jgi:hypothetical protein
MNATHHGLQRDEWERRFHARIADCATDPEGLKLTPEAAKEISTDEIAQWPESGDPHNGPDWMWTLPEEAADEQMGNWLHDQEP